MSTDITQLTIKELKQVLALREKIDGLQNELVAILTAPAAPITKTKKGRKLSAVGAKPSRKGGNKEKILAALQAAQSGITVPDLAKQLQMKAANVRAWIYTTGRKLGVRKIGRGVFALKSQAEAEVKPTAPVKPAKPAKKKRTMSVEQKAKLRELAKKRWARIHAEGRQGV